MQSFDDILSSLIGVVEQDGDLCHLLPVLLEAQRAFARGNEFSKEDVDRVAEMIEGLHAGGNLLEKALRYAEQSGPNMFARAVATELERRRGRRDQAGALSTTNR